MIKINKDFLVGAALGFGAGLLVKSLRDGEDSALRGLLKSGLHAAMVCAEKLKEGALIFKETMEDLTAEVKHERNPEEHAESGNPDAGSKNGKSESHNGLENPFSEPSLHS